MSRDAQEDFELYKSLLILREPQIDTKTYQVALDNRSSVAKTGDATTDELMDGLTDALNRVHPASD